MCIPRRKIFPWAPRLRSSVRVRYQDHNSLPPKKIAIAGAIMFILNFSFADALNLEESKTCHKICSLNDLEKAMENNVGKLENMATSIFSFTHIVSML